MTKITRGALTDNVDARWDKLRAKIECHTLLLRKQGDVVLKTIKGRRYWYLRFLLPRGETGRRRHASIYIGAESDEELLARTRRLLEWYQAPTQLAKELHAAANFAGALNRLLLRQLSETERRPAAQ
jgi:hypothetical protein